ncbi:unnamed protein product [Closterium sp. NIES-53]
MTSTDPRGANGEMARGREAGEKGGVAVGGVGTHQPANPTLPTSTTPSPTTMDPVKAFSIEKFMGEDYEHLSFCMTLMKLLDMHSPTHPTGIMLLERRLRNIKFIDGEPMQPVLDEMRDIFTKLQGGGVVYPEPVQCVEIVIWLQESWSALAINLNAQQLQWSVDYIRARILEEDLRRRSVESSEEEDGYGVGGGMSDFKKKWKGKNKDNPKEDCGGGQGEVCFYCKKHGHRWRKCYQRPKDWTPPSSSNQHGGKRSRGVMGASGEERDEEKGGKSEEQKAGFFFVNEGATDLAMAAKVLLHPLTHWVIDSGSSWHMTPCVDLLDEIQPTPISTVTSATGAKAKNLISTGRLGDAGVKTEMIGSERYRAYNDERLIWDLQRKGDVHKRMWQIPVLPWWKSGKAEAAASMEESVTKEEQQGVQGDELIGGSAAVKASATSGQATWETWHRRLAHVAVSTLEVMHKEKCVHGLQLQGDGAHYGSGEACMQNKFARFPFSRVEGSAKAPLEVVHMDLSGAAVAIKEDWLPMMERQAMRRVKTLLGAAVMPYKFWPEAVCHVITVKNRVLTHEQRHKLEVAAVWAVHLGMGPDSKGWLMWDPKSKRKLVSHDVKFVEDVMYKDWQQQQQVQIGLRLQEIERSAAKEVQLHLDELHGLELTSDHSGGGEQHVSGPAAEEGLEDESARVDSPT